MGQTVAILLCPFQGKRWLPEQLASLRARRQGQLGLLFAVLLGGFLQNTRGEHG